MVQRQLLMVSTTLHGSPTRAWFRNRGNSAVSGDEISGYKTESVYRRYAIVNDQDIAEAGRRPSKANRDRARKGGIVGWVVR